MTRLIGLYSPAPRSGKTTVAAVLATHYQAALVPFADPLRRLLRTFLFELGVTPNEVSYYLNEAKEQRIPEVDTTARHLLRTLGTEWGRQCVHPDIWAMCWRRKADYFLKRGSAVISDDVRFPNEARAIKELGGEVWCVVRQEATGDTAHASEGALSDFSFDRRVENDSDLRELEAKVQAICDCDFH